MKLIPDWRQSRKWLSMHAMAYALAIQGAWLMVPDDLRSNVPAWVSHAVTAALMAAGLIGRLLDQSPACDESDKAGA